MQSLKCFDGYWLGKAVTLLLSLGVFVVTAGYNVFLDGSKYHTGFYLLFLLPGVICLIANHNTSWKVLKEPVFVLAAVFILTIAASVLYPDTVTRPGSELTKVILILVAMMIIGSYIAANARLFWQVLLVGVLAVAMIAAYQLYLYYLVDQNPIGTRFWGYYIPENPLYMAQSLGFFFIVSIHVAIERRCSPVTVIAMVISGAFLLVSALATQSRSFLVAAVLAMAFSFFRKGWKTVLVILLVVFVVLLLMFSVNPAMLERTQTVRIAIWKEAFDFIGERPIIGWGGEYDPGFLGGNYITDPHNILLTIWLKYGLPAFVALTTLLAYAFFITQRNIADKMARLGGSLLVFGVTMLFFEGHNIISKPNSTWHMVWIPMGVILGATLTRVQDSGAIR